MSDLKNEILTRVFLARKDKEIRKEKPTSLDLALELLEKKDEKISALRIYVEELQRKKLELLDNVLEKRKSLNLREDIWKQDCYFLQEEIKTRDNHINKLEKEIRSLRARVS